MREIVLNFEHYDQALRGRDGPAPALTKEKAMTFEVTLILLQLAQLIVSVAALTNQRSR